MFILDRYTGKRFQCKPLPQSTKRDDELFEAFQSISLQWMAPIDSESPSTQPKKDPDEEIERLVENTAALKTS